MMRISAFLIMMIFFAPPVLAQSGQNAGTSCHFEYDICEATETLKDIHPEDLDCFNQKPLWMKLSYLDCTPHLSNAWMHLHKNKVLGGPEPDTAMSILKYRALFYSQKDNEGLHELIKKHGLDMPKIDQMFTGAIEWAKTEREKSADELYALSKSPSLDELYPENMADLFQSLYLRMAYKKGHKAARKEIRDRPVEE